jgi:hypothetical protein
VKTRICDECLSLKWNKYLGPGQATGYRCAKGHKPRMYRHPDPHIVFEIKRKCADYAPNTKLKSTNGGLPE